MKKNLLVIMLLTLISLSFAANTAIDFDYSLTELNLLRSDMNGLDLNYKISDIKSLNVKTEKGNFDQLMINQFVYTSTIGEPKLPLKRKIIAVPLGAKVVANADAGIVNEYSLSDLGINNKIMPAQASIEKCENAKVDFKIDNTAYNVNNYTRNSIVKVEELGILRGLRLFAIDVMPIQYNPAKGMIKVHNNINVSVEFNGGNTIATKALLSKTASPVFQNIYNSSVLNYSSFASDRDELLRNPVKYVIVSDRIFEDTLAPFIQWKNEQGYNTIVAYTDEIGSTTSEIKTYLEGLWDAATEENPAPSYILFVGDVDQVPAFNGTEGSHITDLDYVKYEGDDYMPEVMYSRFSANTVSELEPQVAKTVEYEKYEMADPSFLDDVVMIAGVDSGHAPTYGNGQINYGSDYYFNEENGINSHTYLYPESGSSASEIIQNVSDGASYVNYTAHGSSVSWSDPSFEISDINGLSNEGQYPTVVGNCCLTNKFEVGTCFGEAWLRADNKGAIGYIGGTNSTYWDEDFWWGVGATSNITANPTYEDTGLGVYDRTFHSNGEEQPVWATTQGSMIIAGNLAVVEGNSSRIDMYWEIYSLMGDASLSTFISVPEANTVSVPATIFIGVGQAQVSADPYSYVGLSFEGEFVTGGMVDESGSITLEFDPITTAGDAKIVVTRQNRQPSINTVPVVPNDGPFISSNFDGVIDGDNQQADYSETVSLEMTFENVGSDPAEAATVTLSTDDTNVTITTNTVNLDALAAGAIVTPEDMFEISVNENIEDGHMASFNVEISAGTETWESSFSVQLHAPVIEVVGYTIDDSEGGNGNGRLDADETANVLLTLVNSGSSDAIEVSGDLSSTNEYITLDVDTFAYNGITAGTETEGLFTVTTSADSPTGEMVNFDFAAIAFGNYSTEFAFTECIGQIPVLIIDLDENNNSAPVIGETLDTMGVPYESLTSLPEDLNLYASVFVCLGIYSNNAQLSAAQGTTLAAYVENGGNIYMEGGDTWAFDEQTAVHELFNISGDTDGSSDLETVNGVESTFTDGMEFAYSGENNWIDQLSTIGDAFAIFNNDAAGYTCAIANDGGNYKTIGSSFEFGGLDDATSTKVDLLTNYLAFFGIGEQPQTFNPVQNLIGTRIDADEDDEQNDIQLNWEAPVSNDEVLTGYEVYKIGETETLLATLDTETLEYLHMNQPYSQLTYGIKAVYENGSSNMTIVELEEVGEGDIFEATELLGNYPNPYSTSSIARNGGVSIKFNLKENSDVKVSIFNIKGQKITSINKKDVVAGTNTVKWNVRNSSDKEVGTGIYFYKFEAKNYKKMSKLLIIK